MSAMGYLVRKEVKNTLLDLLRHPARLILYLFFVALLAVSLVSQLEEKRHGGYLDFRILHGGYLGVLLLIGVPVILSGLKSGATFFKMSDVNFLFVSPISPKRILAYGLLKQMGASLLMMFFLLFYSGMASDAFGIAPWQTAVLVFGVALMVFLMQVFALLIYNFANGSARRVLLIKSVLCALAGVAAVFLVFRFLAGGGNQEALLAAVSSPVLAAVPIFGWVKGMIFGILEGNAAETAAYAALNLAALASGIYLFIRGDSDYYEDVLQSTETAFELRSAVKQGRALNLRRAGNRTVRVTDTGLGRGWGASVFFFKHLRQQKRKSRLPFLGTSTLFLAAGNVILALFIRNISGSGTSWLPAGVILLICLCASSYILFFFNLTGDWSVELTKPYIYLVPERPFDKLVWASLSTVARPAVDGIVIFSVLCAFLRANPATAILCMLLYASVGFLYVSVNVLSVRLFGQVANKGIMMLFYMLLLAVLFAPGAVISGVLYWAAPWLPAFLAGLPIAVWNLTVSLGVFAACRNLLGTVEYYY